MNAESTIVNGAAEPAARRPLPRERFERRVVCLLGLPFDTVDLPAAVEHLRAAALSNTRCFVSTPNLNFVIAARTDPGFRDSVLHSDLSLPDGAPIVWIARWLGLPIVERVAGASVFEALRAHAGPPLTVFFFGGPPGVAEAACERLNARPSGLRCVGFDDAGFGSVEDMSAPERIAKINRSGAQFVVVSLGAKKGQAWIERNAAVLAAPLLCHLGAVVNFVAGTVRRAPSWAQRLGLEWAWRIKEEPDLWRRYLSDGTAFVQLVWALLLGAGRSTASASREPSKLASMVSDAGHLTICISGAWTEPALAPLRDAFAEALHGGRTVDLEMGGVSTVDAAFIGLVLIAYGSFGQFRLRVIDVPDPVQAIFRSHGASYLLTPAQHRPQASSSEST
ncbi:MAG: WecB/TagA/CpsF family glycosyltransferase [Pseudomonadota bacterium]|nr:WecB/TagA/CpsF family glycosyltransferase [Pseudomonadota bacterium]